MSSKKQRSATVVNEIIEALLSRKGFDEAFDVDDDILDEIKGEMTEIICDTME